MVLQPVDIDGFTANALDASEVTAAISNPGLTPRAWYRANPDRTVANGLEDTLQMLKEVLLRDHYVVSLASRHPVHKTNHHSLRVFLVSGVPWADLSGFHLIVSLRSAKVQQ